MKGLKFVALNKNGNVTNKIFKCDIAEELPELLNKSTRMKMPTLPMKLYSYTFSNFRMDIWGYINGKAGQENTHDLPPNATCFLDQFTNADTDLLFGDSFVLKYVNDIPTNIDINEYAQNYTSLMGGFEDLDDTDGELSEDEEPTQEDLDFIADDDSELSTDDSWVPEDDFKPDSNSGSDSGSDSESDPE